MANKKGFLLILAMLAGCNGISWCNKMGAGSSQPLSIDPPSSVYVIADVMRRVGTIERFIQYIIRAPGDGRDIKDWAACIKRIAYIISRAVASISPPNTSVRAVDDANANIHDAVRYVRRMVSWVRNRVVDRQAVACVMMRATIAANRNLFRQGYTIVALIRAVRSLVDASFRIADRGHVILSLIHAVELLAGAAESLVYRDVNVAAAVARVAIHVVRVAVDLSNHLLRMLSGHGALPGPRHGIPAG